MYIDQNSLRQWVGLSLAAAVGDRSLDSMLADATKQLGELLLRGGMSNSFDRTPELATKLKFEALSKMTKMGNSILLGWHDAIQTELTEHTYSFLIMNSTGISGESTESRTN